MSYLILRQRHFYGNTIGVNSRWLPTENEIDQIEEFPTLAEARDGLAKIDQADYYLGHGESGRPDYQIASVTSRRGAAALCRAGD